MKDRRYIEEDGIDALPIAADVKALHEYLEKEIPVKERELEEHTSRANWNVLYEMVYTSLTLFNF